MSFCVCKSCGGNLQIEDNVTVGTCEFCGTLQTVPLANDDKKMALFVRANRLRFSCEFDKASGVYESIVAEFPEEAEAYWGLILCKFGIEYVDDPATGKKVPTCHRTSFENVLDDPDFNMVMEHATYMSKKLYREEAKRIEELRRDIVETSSKEEPYDIFICYKETDVNGDRTVDSLIAQDVYDALTEKGYRVFFARVTLEDKLGQMYEPYIFSALQSAKIMLAIGTDYEHYNAVWVKNEWSRFLQLIEKGEKKTLIPCYKNIDAYDIPKEFASLQAQDMGKVGAIQDLLRGIGKILPKKEAVPEKIIVKETMVSTANAGNVEPLLKRAFMFLEDGQWNDANAYCERVLDLAPENAQAYLGKLMAEKKVRKPEKLKDCAESFERNGNYKKAIRFGDDTLKTTLSGYNAHIKKHKEEERQESIYQEAFEASRSNDKKAYSKAASLFSTIRDYKDAAELEQKYLKLMETRNDAILERARTIIQKGSIRNLEEAIGILQEIPEWKDASELIEEGERRINELKFLEDRRQKRNKRIKKFAVAFVILAVIVGGISLIPWLFLKSGNYAVYIKWYKIKDFEIEDGVTEIRASAFKGCTDLESITIPNSVKRIGEDAFKECRSLKNVTIPDGVTSIGNSAFYNCSSLTSVHITDLAAWCNIDFYNYASNPLYYANNLYLNGILITELVIPDSVTSIGNVAFYNCSSLTSITIPDSVTSIGNVAFYNCSSLTSVTIGNGVTSIGDSAFSSCSSLTSVTIPDSVTSIGSSAFSHCSSLTSVTIGNGVTSIGDWAFHDCSSLTTVYYGGTASEWNGISIDSFNSELKSATRYYYSETRPTTAGKYWHYVDGVPTKW